MSLSRLSQIPKRSNDTRTILNYIEANKIPMSLLLLLVIQFVMIIIDRFLYLRKNITGKVIFHIFVVFYTHCWLFMVFPVSTNSSLTETFAPKCYYIIKCIYMLLSAYQIRDGYSTRIAGNFLMNKVTTVRMIMFKMLVNSFLGSTYLDNNMFPCRYMLIPFLFELRTVIDWMFTNTSLLFSEWVKVESIHAQAYGIKCKRHRNMHDFPRGQKQSRLRKLLIGGALTMFLLIILWFPLILFAISPSLGSPIIPEEVEMTLQIGNYEPLFKVVATKSNIPQFDERVWHSIISLYEKNPSASIFLQEYKARDVVAVNLKIDSSSSWNVPAKNIQNMIDELNSGALKSAYLKYKFYRPMLQSNVPDTIQHSSEVPLDDDIRQKIAVMLKGSEKDEAEIPNIFTKFINLQNNGKLRKISQLFSITPDCNNFESLSVNFLKIYTFQISANLNGI